jgi:hypothetical protein
MQSLQHRVAQQQAFTAPRRQYRLVTPSAVLGGLGVRRGSCTVLVSPVTDRPRSALMQRASCAMGSRLHAGCIVVCIILSLIQFQQQCIVLCA